MCVWGVGGGTIFDQYIITSKPSKAHLFTFIFTTVQKLPTPVESSSLGSRCQRAGGPPRLGSTKDERTRGVVRQVRPRQRSAPQSDGGLDQSIKFVVEVVEMLEMWRFLEGVGLKVSLKKNVKVGEVVERE